VFVTTLNSSGTGLLFSTYLGGYVDDYGMGIALDSANNAYVAGQTSAPPKGKNNVPFPTTPGAYRTTPGGGFVFKIDPPVSGAEGSFASTLETASRLVGNDLLPVLPVSPATASTASVSQPMLPAQTNVAAADVLFAGQGDDGLPKGAPRETLGPGTRLSSLLDLHFAGLAEMEEFGVAWKV
jgi:hypothetical protein